MQNLCPEFEFPSKHKLHTACFNLHTLIEKSESGDPFTSKFRNNGNNYDVHLVESKIEVKSIFGIDCYLQSSLVNLYNI
jgi:hypothetical protein